MPDQFSYARWLEELWANEKKLRELAAELGEEGFVAPPPGGGWSAAQCVEHLVMTARQMLPLWDAALAGAKPGNGVASYAWWEKQFLRLQEPPYRIKSKTIDSFEPKRGNSREETMELYLAAHELVKERAERLSNLNVAQVKIASPFASWMHYNVAFSFDLLLAHERRHLWQAEQTAPRPLEIAAQR
jgi:hypothetical protein